ncbi:MAG: hypothetical protein ACLU38_15255 [Dysosmobacter sp.]
MMVAMVLMFLTRCHRLRQAHRGGAGRAAPDHRRRCREGRSPAIALWEHTLSGDSIRLRSRVFQVPSRRRRAGT